MKSRLALLAALIVPAAASGQEIAFHRPERDKDIRSASLSEEMMRKAEEKRKRKAAKRKKEQQ